MKARQEVLRRLVTEYQQTRSTSSFSGILKRVDKLVLYVIHKLVRINPHLKEIEIEDLYHTAIVGVGEAVLTTLDEEDGDKITARIIAYIKSNIKKVYGGKWGKLVFVDISYDSLYNARERPGQVDFTQGLYEDEDYLGFYLSKILNGEELKLLFKKFVQGKTYKEIGKELGLTGQGVCYRVKKVLKKLRRRMEIENRSNK